jgi:hypothetical protein
VRADFICFTCLHFSGAKVSDTWYYADRSGQVGPLNLRDLKATFATIESIDEVFVWCDRFPDWKAARDVPELNDLAKRRSPPPLPLDAAMKEARPGRSIERALRPREVPIIGIIATGVGLASAIMPYFAAVFFAPAGLICGAIALAKKQRGWGISAIVLSLIGVGGIIYTSEQISSIFTYHPGGISLPQSPFAPAPIVTHAQYDQISEGMTYEQVRSIIGTAGNELSRSNIAGVTTVMYAWTNSNGSNMNAMFQNNRLINKAQFGLR